ncbi:hypothetical protein [Sporolactobacillus terrae]|uniref:Uncharacterized protein n=1 Tax=Sporolactobacillus terrae TaxID=269673 RepID=A0A5K7WYS8_9BACL|nr:hypothetical protein [Sporolactobacillus terrae]BBN97503.1 hypothetical protein St703_02080 [Sporolactobacillus terrae]
MDKRKVLNQITAIRIALDTLEEEVNGAPGTSCPHTHKKILTTMGGPEEWRCEDCGFHFVEGGK